MVQVSATASAVKDTAFIVVENTAASVKGDSKRLLRQSGLHLRNRAESRETVARRLHIRGFAFVVIAILSALSNFLGVHVLCLGIVRL